MKKAWFLNALVLPVLLLNACGMNKKIERKTVVQRSEQLLKIDEASLYLTDHRDDVFIATSDSGKHLESLFLTEDKDILSSQNFDFPIGAVEAQFRSTDEEFEPIKVEFVTCCGKRLEARLTHVGNQIYHASEFILSKPSFQLLVTFSDGDVVTFSRPEVSLES